MTKRDYYETSGVERTASDDEIKKAYRKIARQHHPDLQTGDQQKKISEEKFKEVNEAYEDLSDQDKRQRYDMFGHTGGPQGAAELKASTSEAAGSESLQRHLRRFFGGHTRGGQRTERGTDLQYNLEVSFEESVYGKEAKLENPPMGRMPRL